MDNYNALVSSLSHRLDAHERRDRRYHADCPFCGKEAKKAQTHFSFCEHGYTCWVCGAKGGLVALSRHLGMQQSDAQPAPRLRQQAQEPRRAYGWQDHPIQTVARFLEAPERVRAWQAYKPLTAETISRWRLGLGVLPASRCKTPRLIVPVYEGDTLVALHGRAYRPGDDDAKWLTSGGSRKDVLFGGDDIRPGCTVIVCENMVDCLLARQAEPDAVTVAGGGVAWQSAWTERLARANVRGVVVWLDHDLAGNGGGADRPAMLRAWRAEMQQRIAAGKIRTMPPEPEPAGIKIVNELLAAGVTARLYPWPKGTPPKADLGWALMQ